MTRPLRAAAAAPLAAALLATVACEPRATGPPPWQADIALAQARARGSDVAYVAQHLVVNELRAEGEDWVELSWGGEEPVSLASYVLAERDAAGEPDLDGAVPLPAQEVLAPGAYLLVVAGVDDPASGLTAACLPEGGPPTCLHAGWGLSDSEGDRVVVVAFDGQILAAADYPPGAAPEGTSWARLPDGSGDFAPATPTPGEANRSLDE